MDVKTIKERAAAIRDEQRALQNTARRVGGVLVDMADVVDETQANLNGFSVDYPITLTNWLAYGDSNLPHKIAKGTSVTADINIVNGTTFGVYGKTNIDDSSYMTMFNGSGKAVVADRDINYIQIAVNGYDSSAGGQNSFTFHYSQKGVADPTFAKVQGRKMYNYPINMRKDGLKILWIGNSFCMDATEELYSLCNAAGINTGNAGLKIRRLTHGGGSFKTWRDIYTRAGELDGSYSYTACIDSDWSYNNSPDTDNTLMINVLSQEWDLIIIQQVSTFSGSYEMWEGNGEGGYLREFIKILRITNPSASIGFVAVHSTNSAPYDSIAQSVEYVNAKYGFDFIIPYGCAIEGLRKFMPNTRNFTRDGHHLAYGMAQYTAACVTFQSIFGPRGYSVVGNTYRITKRTVDEKASAAMYTEDCMHVNDNNAFVAQMLAMSAVCDYSTVATVGV